MTQGVSIETLRAQRPRMKKQDRLEMAKGQRGEQLTILETEAMIGALGGERATPRTTVVACFMSTRLKMFREHKHPANPHYKKIGVAETRASTVTSRLYRSCIAAL